MNWWYFDEKGGRFPPILLIIEWLNDWMINDWMIEWLNDWMIEGGGYPPIECLTAKSREMKVFLNAWLPILGNWGIFECLTANSRELRCFWGAWLPILGNSINYWIIEWLNDWMIEWLNDWMIEWLKLLKKRPFLNATEKRCFWHAYGHKILLSWAWISINYWLKLAIGISDSNDWGFGPPWLALV